MFSEIWQMNVNIPSTVLSLSLSSFSTFIFSVKQYLFESSLCLFLLAFESQLYFSYEDIPFWKCTLIW